MRLSPRHFTRISLFALLAVPACHRGALTLDSPSAPSTAPRITEGNIVAIILAANNTDLSYARLVPSRSSNVAVKAFAERMATDHSILNERANDIAARNGITAEDHPVSLDFRDHSAERRDVLRELKGARFDSTYIANEIQYHQELLAALAGALLPNARTPELREFVMSLKPAVSAHLSHAETIRAALMKK